MRYPAADSLKALLDKLVPLNEPEWNRFQDSFSARIVPAKTKLTAEGQVATELFYLQSGLMRLLYTRPNGDQITSFLFSEGMFASCHESFLAQQPSLQTLETLEPCLVLVISKEALDRLYQEVPSTHVIMRRVVEQRFINAQRLFASYLLDSPQERYRKFADEHPELLQRVPQYILASFLGITPVSLSRIRKRMSERS
ncbi:Crp/Fnr family transcriptional regulator [Larkinella ripae]